MTQTGKNKMVKMEKMLKSQYSIKDILVDVALSIYDHDKNHARDGEIFHSRLCLESLLPENLKLLNLNSGHEAVTFPQEIIRKHYSLNQHFRFDILESLGTGSISHTRGLAGFALCSKGFGIGLDLEWRDRPMKMTSQRLFKHDQDEDSFFLNEQTLLSLWCIKEAAFKALSLDGAIQKTHEHPVLSHIYVRGNEFFHKFDQNLKGTLKQEVLENDGREFVLTLALKNEN